MPTIEKPMANLVIFHTGDGAPSYAFSYATCVGVNAWNGRGWVARENVWGVTTGKHLNYLSRDKSTRVDASTFAQVCAELVERAQ